MSLATLPLRTLDIWLPLVLAIITSLVLVTVVERRLPGVLRGMPVFTAMVLAGLWAGAVWVIRPLGVTLRNSALLYGLGTVVLGIVIALVTPRVPPTRRRPREPARETAITVGMLFWLLMFALLILWVSGMILA